MEELINAVNEKINSGEADNQNGGALQVSRTLGYDQIRALTNFEDDLRMIDICEAGTDGNFNLQTAQNIAYDAIMAEFKKRDLAEQRAAWNAKKAAK